MYGGDAGVAFKIPLVVGQDAVDPVDLHPSHKSRVVNLNPFHFMLDEELSPFRIHRSGIAQRGSELDQGRLDDAPCPRLEDRGRSYRPAWCRRSKTRRCSARKRTLFRLPQERIPE